MAKFYGVKVGLVPGVYDTWAECENNIKGFSGAQFKSFPTKEEALNYVYPNKKPPEGDENVNSSTEKTGKVLTAYVDGSFNVSNKKYGYGVVLLFDNMELHIADVGRDVSAASMRNVAGEILASEQAMIFASLNGFNKVVIYHDYEGIAKWCTGEWSANNPYTKAYAETFKKFSKVLDIEFIKVDGHSGDKYNDITDMLAKSQIF